MKIDDLATPVLIIEGLNATADSVHGLRDMVIIGIAPCAMIGALEERFLTHRPVTVVVGRDEWPNLLEWRPEWGIGIVCAGYLRSLIVHRDCEPHHVEIEVVCPARSIFTRISDVHTIQGPSIEEPPA